MFAIIKGDLLEAKEQYIAHACNAVSNQAGGLAHYIFKKFPYANIYSSRPFPYRAIGKDFPGHIVIKGTGSQKRIINMLTQYYPGTSNDELSLKDGIKARISYFTRCLIDISKIDGLESVAFPKFVCCGLAGGDWLVYSDILEKFSKKLKEKQNAKVVLYDNA